MSTGICLVATDGGALPEVTGRDGDTVLQCKAGDVESLVSALRRGLDSAEVRERIGAAGRQRVVERWSWKYCAQLTVDQYREVLAMPANVEKLRRNGRI
jgi:glycosyltransferase involved in cell wall biosynthesis